MSRYRTQRRSSVAPRAFRSFRRGLWAPEGVEPAGQLLAPAGGSSDKPAVVTNLFAAPGLSPRSHSRFAHGACVR